MHWYKIASYKGRTLDQVRELLAPLGITQRDGDVGRVHYWYDDEAGPMKAIGDLVVRKRNGSIEIWPYRGVDEHDHRVLLASAEDAFRNPASRQAGWTLLRRQNDKSYWRCSVCIQVPEREEMFNIMMAGRLPENVDAMTDREAHQAHQVEA